MNGPIYSLQERERKEALAIGFKERRRWPVVDRE